MKEQTPEAAWDAMTDEKKIFWLTMQIVGWQLRGASGVPYGWFLKDKQMFSFQEWDPLHNWNHWRVVEEEVIQSGMIHAVVAKFAVGNFKGNYVEADLPTRCKALYIAFHSLLPNE